MLYKQTLIFFVFAPIFFFSAKAEARTSTNDSLLVLLEKNMEQSKEFSSEKEGRILKLKELLGEKGLSAERIYALNKRIIAEYEAYRFDSSLFYINQNLKLANQIGENKYTDESRLLLVNLMASSGRIKEAMDIMEQIDRASVAKEQLINYYHTYRKLYSDLNFYAKIQENKQKYRAVYDAYADSLLNLLAPETDAYLAIKETQMLDARRLMDCRKINTKRLALTQVGTRLYSQITFFRSLTYQLENNIENQKEYLILSAISDIKAAVKDNASLTMLAIILFKEGDVQRAHRFINFALEDAVFYNSQIRFFQISNILPLITTAYEQESEMQKTKLRQLLTTLSVLAVILLFSVIYIYMQVKKTARARNELAKANKKLNLLNDELHQANDKLNALNEKLSDANIIKENYIGNFLEICSNYIEKLDNFRKHVNKKIAGRKVQELFDQTKNQELIDNELKEFYKTFDDTFLHIYPNFVPRINELLQSDQQIVLKDDERLNTELRIFALIRLGIADSSQIAHLLHYSVNTIYNYRAKLKNKAAIARDEFEDRIMEIGA